MERVSHARPSGFTRHFENTNTESTIQMLKSFTASAIGAVILIHASSAYANGQCPSIGLSPSCSILITINPNGSLSFKSDPSVPPFDGVEDVLVGVVNKSGAAVFGISLIGNDIFGFDGDGAGTLVGSFGPTGYEGPGTSFTKIDDNRGTVNFTSSQGLPDQGFIWFSLEGDPDSVQLSQRITIDPGHGLSCTNSNGSGPAGAEGITDFKTPPLGKLREDPLTVAVAAPLANILRNQHFIVGTTKTDVQSCPTLRERGQKANNDRSNVFVSVHLNAPLTNVFTQTLFSGTKVLYDPAKSDSQTLAQLMAGTVSAALGLSNQGVDARTDLAVLKPTVSRMTAVIAEVARLSPPDDVKVHDDPAFAVKAANGIASAVNAFFSQ